MVNIVDFSLSGVGLLPALWDGGGVEGLLRDVLDGRRWGVGGHGLLLLQVVGDRGPRLPRPHLARIFPSCHFGVVTAKQDVCILTSLSQSTIIISTTDHKHSHATLVHNACIPEHQYTVFTHSS